MLLSFKGLSRPVALIDCDELALDIADILRDWPFKDSVGSAAEPVITVNKTEKGYRRGSPWLSKPAVYRHRVDAVCDFIVDLVNGYIADDPQLLCLHCAAVEFERGLVVFPNPYKAGKSTLSVHLAATGARLFADDVLPIRSPGNRGVALGILPRLRLPLPDDAGERFLGFVRERSGAKSKKFLYLNLKKKELAPFGTSAPIRGVVLLRREQTENPVLIPVSKGDAMKETIRRNFARKAPALDIFDRLQSVVEKAECFDLRYQTAEQAADLLRNTFGLKAETRIGNS